LRPDLDDREWPTPLNLDPRYRDSALMDRLRRARREGLVSEGYVVAKELAIRGSAAPIPAGECAVTSLALGDGWVFGATSGRRAHVFAYCPRPADEVVLELAALEGHAAVRNALAWLPDYGLFAGTSAPDREGYAGGEVLRIGEPRLTGSVIQEWTPLRSSVESLGVPVAGEGVACMIAGPGADRLYGLSDGSGTLFSVDAASGGIETHGSADELRRFSPHLIAGPDGLIYACGTTGRIVRYRPGSAGIEETGMALPTMAGRAQYGRVGAWSLDRRAGLVYAGDVADGLLSVLDVRSGRTRVLGKPTTQPHVRALAVAPDGRVYGIAGQRGGIGHLFRYSPRTGELRDLGVMAAGTERRWYGYEFDCALAGPDGRVYFGESDRISHLFLYFPPIPAEAPPPAQSPQPFQQ
jgi:hypothetical protein